MIRWKIIEIEKKKKMIRRYHQLNGQEFEQALGDGEGQGSLTCSSPWGCRVRHNSVTEQIFNTHHP